MSKISATFDQTAESVVCNVNGPSVWNARMANFSDATVDAISRDDMSVFCLVGALLNTITRSIAKYPEHGAAIATRYEVDYVVCWKIETGATTSYRKMVTDRRGKEATIIDTFTTADHVTITVTKVAA